MLSLLSIEDFAEKLASREPAPGGGSAAALSGLMGTSLVEMVINLSLDQADLAAEKPLLSSSLKRLEELHSELAGLIEKDAEAFRSVMSAFKLPKALDTEKQMRSAAIQATMTRAAEVPLQTASACLESMSLGAALPSRVNPHAISDLMCGALSLHAGVIGALLNTAINIPSLKDLEVAEGLRKKSAKIRKQADEYLHVIENAIYEMETFTDFKS